MGNGLHAFRGNGRYAVKITQPRQEGLLCPVRGTPENLTEGESMIATGINLPTK